MADRLTYTVPEAAELLGVSDTTLYDLIRRGRIGLRVHRIGRQLRISKALLDAYLAGETTDATPGSDPDPGSDLIPFNRRKRPA